MPDFQALARNIYSLREWFIKCRAVRQLRSQVHNLICHVGQGWDSNSKQREVGPSLQESRAAGRQRDRCTLKERWDQLLHPITPKDRDKPQNLVSDLLVIPLPWDTNFLHALGGFFPLLCYYPHFSFFCSIHLFSHLIFFRWKKKYPWFQLRSLMLFHRILSLSNDCVAFLNITRWVERGTPQKCFPQLVVISVSLASMPTSSCLFL